MATARASTLMSSGPLMQTMRKWAFSLSGYNKLGLYAHDLLYETPDVNEAIRRLTPEQTDDRNWRVQRALQAEIGHYILPKEEWTQFEDNWNNGHYLKDILERVEFERKEREEWEKK